MSNTKKTRKVAVPREEVLKILDFLKEKHAVFQKAKPLCYTIKDEILAEHPNMTRTKLKVVLGVHTKSPKYLRKTLSKTHRYNLKEEKVSEITEGEKEWAKVLLGKWEGKNKKSQSSKEQKSDNATSSKEDNSITPT
jgi:sRNA-binding protein